MSHKVLLCVKNGIFDFLNGLFMFAAESGEDVFKNACGKKKKKNGDGAFFELYALGFIPFY